MLLQERRLIGRQLIPGEGGIDHALLEDIEHIADEGERSSHFPGWSVSGFSESSRER